MTARRKAVPADPVFAAEMAALEAEHYAAERERAAEFRVAWAERLKQGNTPVHSTPLHTHTDACWRKGEERTVEWAGTTLGWYSGRYCRLTGFVPEAPAANPTAVRR